MHSTISNPKIKPLVLSSFQGRSIKRHLADAGRHCQVTSYTYEGRNLALFLGVTGAEVIAAAQTVQSLQALGWLKVVLAEITVPDQTGPLFCSALLEWEHHGHAACHRQGEPC